jgi:hypothetical protein
MPKTPATIKTINTTAILVCGKADASGNISRRKPIATPIRLAPAIILRRLLPGDKFIFFPHYASLKNNGSRRTQLINQIEDRCHIPFAFITAHADEYQENAIAAGGKEVITKPIDFAVLHEVVSKYLG